MIIQMHIAALAIDPLTNSPVVILKDEKEQQSLPIWIGPLEASAIVSELEGIKFSRPMTHDLLKNIMEKLDVTVEKILITDLADNTYYAKIFLRQGDQSYEIDARPSDSMAIALRTKADIFVDDKVISASLQIEVEDKVDLTDEEKMKEILEKLDPDSFKYKM